MKTITRLYKPPVFFPRPFVITRRYLEIFQDIHIIVTWGEQFGPGWVEGVISNRNKPGWGW